MLQGSYRNLGEPLCSSRETHCKGGCVNNRPSQGGMLPHLAMAQRISGNRRGRQSQRRSSGEGIANGIKAVGLIHSRGVTGVMPCESEKKKEG